MELEDFVAYRDTADGFLKTLKDTSVEIQRISKVVSDLKESPITGDRYIGVKEAAKILGCNQNTIYDLVKQGALDTYTLPTGSNRKYKLSEVLAVPRKEGADGNNKRHNKPE